MIEDSKYKNQPQTITLTQYWREKYYECESQLFRARLINIVLGVYLLITLAVFFYVFGAAGYG